VPKKTARRQRDIRWFYKRIPRCPYDENTLRFRSQDGDPEFFYECPDCSRTWPIIPFGSERLPLIRLGDLLVRDHGKNGVIFSMCNFAPEAPKKLFTISPKDAEALLNWLAQKR
jgi:hypothetical protein